MRIGAAAAGRGTQDQLLRKVVPGAQEMLRGETADLGLLFATNHFEDEMWRLAERIRDATKVRHLIGCTGESVIGPEHEYENQPALALWLAQLPGTNVQPFQLAPGDLETPKSVVEALERQGVDRTQAPKLVALGDPFSVDIDKLLAGLNSECAGAALIGGMASGSEAPGQAALVLNDNILREGLVGVTLSGAANLATVVSQGCRPVGRPMVITKAEKNIVYELSGRKPLEVLNQIFAEAPASEQQLLRTGVFLGRAINEQKGEFQRGDFLIRNLLGADEASGAIAVGDRVRVGITVQFHIRDAATADEDLRHMLAAQVAPPPAGAVLFSCNGRGSRMFSKPDHDVGVLRTTLGALPVAGFFCAGELGPVGGKNFIHGHTASIGLFRPA